MRQPNYLNTSIVVCYIAEVVESSTTEVVAECRQLNLSPPFGAFVRIDSEPVALGVVFNIATRSLDPTRRPIAYGKTEEELRLEQPQIFELLRTEFHALLVGFRQDKRGQGIETPSPSVFHQTLPPQPPRLHSFVYICDKEEVRAFASQHDYLRLLLNASRQTISDELIIAACRTALAAHDNDPQYLIRLGKELARLLPRDYDRLNAIVRRIAQ
ncbi:MAG: hypothetical protein NZT92_06845 [Abditibacteriales bacterium]|nr:hypothetical protein [Abditibacteriales bacterium]